MYLNFRTKYWELFILDKAQEFRSGLVDFKGLFFIRKNIKLSAKRSRKSNCKDYAGECSSRQHCIDRCISKTFYEKHKSLTIFTVIDNVDFRVDSLNFSQERDYEIEAYCLNKFRHRDCRDVYFDESLELTGIFSFRETHLKLDYENLVEKELEQSLTKTIVDSLNLISIFTGLSATSLLSTIANAIRTKFDFKAPKSRKCLIVFVCIVGFLTHNVFIFKSIIMGDLIESGYFKRLDKFRSPNPIFCLPFNESKTDPNYKLNGNYLDTLTSELSFGNIFEKIIYHNKTHYKKLTTGAFKEARKTISYLSSELELSHFYYKGMKCFEIADKIQYEEEDFHFAYDKFILEVHLNRNFIEKYSKYLFFLYRDSRSNQIGGGFYYYISNISDFHYSYHVEFRLFQIERKDNLQLLKNPLSILDENSESGANKYLNVMKRRFKANYNLTSHDNVVDDFGATIDDGLFEQYYLQIQNVTDYYDETPSNFRQNVYSIYTQPILRNKTGFEDFIFSHSFTSRQMKITNKENYTKLVISILNTFSLWFSLCVLDIVIYIHKTVEFFIRCYCLLIKFKAYLFFKLIAK